MKTIILSNLRLSVIAILIIFTLPTILNGQGMVISEEPETAIPHGSAILDIRANDKGVLVPRMFSNERDAIVEPANGLLVFDMDENHFYFYDGNAATWKKIAGSSNGHEQGESLFEVRNDEGEIVFAVYPDGVEVIIDDDGINKTRGGFAVSGRTTVKGVTRDLFLVSPDETRVFLDDNGGKGRGGFAVSGRTDTKEGGNDFLSVLPDKTRVFVDDFGNKGRGGFAVSGRTGGKQDSINEYFNVFSGFDTEIISPSQPRVLWHPLKNAFLAGQILIESPEDVGHNSLSIGYETKASGDRSQALGYKSQALGDYSTAIGKDAIAQFQNSFAFGDGAKSLNIDAYAFGTNAEATGEGSYAFGSMGRDSVDVNNFAPSDVITKAEGDFSFAFGLGSQTMAEGAFALGTNVSAYGDYSFATGFNSSSYGLGSVAMGWGTVAQMDFGFAAGFYSSAVGMHSLSLGKLTGAQGYKSVAIGNHSHAEGENSFVLGSHLQAKSAYEVVVGAFNDNLDYVDANPFDWVEHDRLFVIGNGVEEERSNALVVLKNGNVGIGTNMPEGYKLFVDGDAFATGLWEGSDIKLKTNINDLDNVLSKVVNLQGVYYDWDNDKLTEESSSQKTKIGLIAQEVEKEFPELVRTGKDGLKAVSYSNMTVVLLEAIKEQQAQIDALTNEKEELIDQVEQFNTENQNLQKQIDQIKIMLNQFVQEK